MYICYFKDATYGLCEKLHSRSVFTKFRLPDYLGRRTEATAFTNSSPSDVYPCILSKNKVL